MFTLDNEKCGRGGKLSQGGRDLHVRLCHAEKYFNTFRAVELDGQGKSLHTRQACCAFHLFPLLRRGSEEFESGYKMV